MITTTLMAATEYMAAPIWDIGANLKTRGIETAIYFLIGGTAIVGGVTFIFSKNKTNALKVVGFGIILIGIVSALPSLGIVSRDTFQGVTQTYR